MIAVKVDQIFLSNLGFVVLLKGDHDKRSLPIFIGAAEAQAIAIRLNKVEMPRPLTHDLLKNTLDFLECRLKRIEINDLKEGTFYATLILERDGAEMPIDSRPSDAIALALRCGAPIVVAEAVMADAGKVLEESEGQLVERDEDAHVEGKALSPLEALQRKLDAAVRAERYEEAAHLRDAIKHLRKSSGGN